MIAVTLCEYLLGPTRTCDVCHSNSSSNSSSAGIAAATLLVANMARLSVLLLTYDAEAAADCCGMVCPLAGPIHHLSKEPVGHVFHYKMLLQQGVIGT